MFLVSLQNKLPKTKTKQQKATLAGGHRTRIHNAIVDCVFGLARDALATTKREPVPFSGVHARDRPDLALQLDGSRDVTILVDVAMTHPLSASALKDKSQIGPAAAANRYENVKTTKYRDAIAENNTAAGRSTTFLLPTVVADTFTTPSESACSLLKTLAKSWALANGSTPAAMCRIAFLRFSHATASAVG